jgi:chemotaxis signal transduction protein
MERLPALPGMAGFVSGIISLRGEPVTVVDFAMAFGFKSSPDLHGSGHRVVVISDGEKLLGLDVGSLGVSFLWGEDAAKLPFVADSGRYVKGTLGKDAPIAIIEWAPLFNDTVKLLSEGA